MKNRTLLQSTVLLLTIFVFIGSRADGTEITPPEPQNSSPNLMISILKQFGPLERPAVPFAHDRHTQAVAKQGKDCRACHPKTADRMVFSFKQEKPLPKAQWMDLYHSECIGCHKETKASGMKSGPVECGRCHLTEGAAVVRAPMAFDKSLHYRHVKARENQCGQCHHEYDQALGKPVYVKGKEGSCRYCHRRDAAKKIQSMGAASHAACINCHLKTADQNKPSGPVYCYGCHDLKQRSVYKVIADVPRYQRNQPNQIFVQKGQKAEGARMAIVPFDHKAHEGYSNTCIQCHHESLSTCSTCHTLQGDKTGKGVNLEKAMHDRGDASSCIGCHRQQKKAQECAGCHTVGTAGTIQDKAACLKCHRKPVAQPAEIRERKAGTDAEALDLLSKRTAVKQTYPEEEIPEKVVIRQLSKQYKPVEMPHRKMVLTLMDGIQGSKLAVHFHTDEGTVCRGCHHNSPAAKKPPRCESCHLQKPINNQPTYRPGLMGAYHIQCMECHNKMGLKKLSGCTQCHQKKGLKGHAERPAVIQTEG